MDPHHDPAPVNSLPPVIIALALLVAGVEGAFLAAEAGFIGGAQGIGWRIAAVEDYGFYGQVLDLMIQRGDFRFDFVMRFFTYAFIQGSFTQMLFVGVFLLALGKFVGEVFKPIAVLIVFFGAALGGALAYAMVLDDPRPLIGGFPAVYGLIGAYTYILWLLSGLAGQSQFAAFRLIAMLMAIQLVFTALFGGSNDWVADLGGFISGFLLSFLVSPGGLARLQEMMRNR